MSRVGVSWVAIGVSLFLLLLKLVVGFLTGSISVLADAVHSSTDVVAAVMALLAVRLSLKPADDSHNYGHGKFENLSAFLQVILIYLAAGAILLESFRKLFNPVELSFVWSGIAVMGVSAVLHGFVYFLLRRQDSLALKATALHLLTDLVTSIAVMVGLLAVYVTGHSLLDPLLAIVLTLYVCFSAYQLLKDAVAGLVDASLPDVDKQNIEEILESLDGSYHRLRTRRVGKVREVDLHLVVPGAVSVAEAHQLCDRLEERIGQVFEESVTTIHIEPE